MLLLGFASTANSYCSIVRLAYIISLLNIYNMMPLPNHLKLLNKGPTELLPWLLNKQSMTGKLQAATNSPVTLAVLHQKWSPVGFWEKYILGLENTGSVWQREITISAGDTLCWYARTLIPKDTYTAYESIFSRLEKETLGDIIFSDARIARTSLLHYQIDSQCMEYYWLDSPMQTDYYPDKFWLRLSEFHIESASAFYLIEILLPGLLHVTSKTSGQKP